MPESLTEIEINSLAKSSIQKGSKSFALASIFFSWGEQQAIEKLYFWCRTCDDIADGSLLGFGQNTQDLSPERIEVLRAYTRESFQTELSHERANLPEAFRALSKVVKQYGIHECYALDLLSGMQADVQGNQIMNEKDLLLYCYQVAGTVGLMMCQITGVKTTLALRHAVDLGIAFQLTNIARDVGDDYRAGRVYVPRDWLMAEGLTEADLENLLDQKNLSSLEGVVAKMLAIAETKYESALIGIKFLPFRTALAVSIALEVYRQIGIKVLERGYVCWEPNQRVSTGFFIKVQATALGIFRVIITLPTRLNDPRKILKDLPEWKPEFLDHENSQTHSR